MLLYFHSSWQMKEKWGEWYVTSWSERKAQLCRLYSYRVKKRERVNQQLEYLLWVMNWCQTWYFLASFYIHNNIFGCVWLFWSLRTKHRRCHRWTYLGNYNCTTDFVSSKVTFITFWNETGKREKIW